jgi:hypothetical protein
MKRRPATSCCRSEAKRTVILPCAEGTLHRAKPCFILHAPQVRFISKTKKMPLYSQRNIINRKGQKTKNLKNHVK